MAAMIWDGQAQAFKEAETPMKYDPNTGAWTETTGMAYDPDTQAWKEKWNSVVPPLFLYNNGVWDANIGKFIGRTYYQGYGTPPVYEYSTYFRTSTSGCAWETACCTTQSAIDITKYKKLGMYIYEISNRNSADDQCSVGIGVLENNQIKIIKCANSQRYGSVNSYVYEEVIFDISSYVGDYYIYISLGDNGTASETRFHKVWLE